MSTLAPSFDSYHHLRPGTSEPLSLLGRPEPSLAHGAVRDVIDWLGRAIAGGYFPIGSTLPMENELGEQVGVSRTVIREAVKILTDKGVVKTARRYGTVVNTLDHWNLLDADIVSWHEADSTSVGLIFRALVELLNIMLPQATQASLNRLPAHIDGLSELALTTMQDHHAQQRQRVDAEYTIWAQVLSAPKSSVFMQFRGLTYEMRRLTYALEHRHESVDQLYRELLQRIGHGDASEADLTCRLLLKRSKSLI